MSLVRSLVRKYQNIWKKDRVIKISIVLIGKKGIELYEMFLQRNVRRKSTKLISRRYEYRIFLYDKIERETEKL